MLLKLNCLFIIASFSFINKFHPKQPLVNNVLRILLLNRFCSIRSSNFLRKIQCCGFVSSWFGSVSFKHGSGSPKIEKYNFFFFNFGFFFLLITKNNDLLLYKYWKRQFKRTKILTYDFSLVFKVKKYYFV